MTAPILWHAEPAETVLTHLGSRVTGLTEAEAAARLAEWGPNAFRVVPPVSAWVVLLRQLRSLIVVLLLVAMVIAYFLGDVLDAVAILAVLGTNVLIGFMVELRAHRAIESLLGLEVTRARVFREGSVRELDARQLVPGDVIEVEEGVAIPADARLLDSAELRTVEASLTGEAVPVDKVFDAPVGENTPLPERITMLFKATTVVAGRGHAVVVATGMATEVGRIGQLVSRVEDQRTPLELRLDALSRRLIGVALGAAGVVIWIGIRQGLGTSELLQTALALAVAAVPEGLPIVGTIAMAVGVRRMARRNALIRHLPVVEALGSTTLICTDKTGTLTAGEMTAGVVRLYDREVAVSGTGYSPRGDFQVGSTPVDPLNDRSLQLALRICALTARTDVSSANGRWTAVGDPTEAALAVLARKAGLTRTAAAAEWPEIGELPFTSERMLMATVHRSPSGTLACVKGAPRRVVERSTRMLTRHGVSELNEQDRDTLLNHNRELAGRGLRVLAIAMKEGVGAAEESELHGLTWVGFVGLTDPPAPGVKETIAAFHAAGIRVVMLTGDQRLTAERIARDLGMLGAGEEVLDGNEVDRLSDRSLREAIGRAAAFSRVSPEAKLRIVQAYQTRGEIVAMFGDGVNDAAALRQADVGVAMGARGTDMAKEAADLILEDDRFPTIAAAIEQGRVVFDNIRKFVFYLFSCNLAEILVLLGAGLAGLPTPLLPLQILWLNLLTDTVPALALAVEPAEPGIMRQPPRDSEEAILSVRLARSTVGYALLISLATLAAFGVGLALSPEDPVRATTLAFMTLAFAQIFHLGNARSALPVVHPRRVVSNPYALVAVLVTAGLQIMAVEFQPLSRILETHPLRSEDWLIIGALALVPAITGQALKLMDAGRRTLLPVGLP
jgi:P-type Ca2+ transporter type 2C